MPGNSFGERFRITTFGESHGPAIGVTIDGCPSGFEIDTDFIQLQLDRRKPGQSAITTQRREEDTFEIISGVFEGKTTGTPLTAIIKNKDARSQDYENLKNVYRPSHADYTYQLKYGIRDHRGGGRSSARETAARVVAGALAQQILLSKNISVNAYVSQVSNIALQDDYHPAEYSEVYNNSVRCPDKKSAELMMAAIEKIRDEGDSTGGIISCRIRGIPPGLGEPVFDKLQADLAKAMLSINAVHGFEYGSGFKGASQRGSQNNDAFEKTDSGIKTSTNSSGGIQGGISNGEEIYFRIAFKPPASIKKTQQTVDKEGKATEFSIEGRHDPCVVPRAVPIVEAMAAIVILDHYLRNKTVKI